MAILRGGDSSAKAEFSVGLNIILQGSKKMLPDVQQKLMTVDTVRVLIVDAEDENVVLVDEILPAKEFKTGSVGYGLQVRGVEFHVAE